MKRSIVRIPAVRPRALFLAVLACGSIALDPTATAYANRVQVEQARVLARLSRDSLEIGQTLELEIDVVGQGAVDCEIEPLPQIDGVVIEPLSGPELRTTERGPTARYVLSIRALEAGRHRIDGIAVTVRSDLRLAVPPLEFTATAPAAAPQFEFRVVPSLRRAYVHQRVDIDLELSLPPGLEIAEAGSGSLRLPWLPRVSQLPVHTRIVPGQVALEIETHGGRLLLRRLEPDGDRPVRFAARLSVTAPAPGSVELGGATLAVEVHPTSEQDERTAVTATAPRSAVEFVALPSPAPPEFVDLVGRIVVDAAASSEEVGLAEVVKYTVTLTDAPGTSSNLEVALAARLESVPGFRVSSRNDVRAESRLEITLDLVPLRGDLEAIPALPIAWFDPSDGAYVVAETPELELAIVDPKDRVSEEEAVRRGRGLVVIAAGVLLLVAIAMRNKRKLNVPDKPLVMRPTRPELPEGHALAQRLRDASDATAIETAREFSQWLAIRMRCAPYACFGRTAKERLLRHGIQEALAERVACYYDEVEARSYGAIPGIARFAAIEQLRALIDELESQPFTAPRQRTDRDAD